MKKLIFGFIAIFLLTGFQEASAQDWNDLYKDGRKAFTRYSASTDDAEKKEYLASALSDLDKALEMEIPDDEKSDIYLLRGDVYGDIAEQINTAKTLQVATAAYIPEEVTYPAVRAMQDYAEALKYADKGRHERAATDGLREMQNYMSFRGIEYFQSSDFGGAMAAFEGMLDAHKLLNEAGEDSALASDEDINNQKYLAAIATFNAGAMPKAKVYLMELYDDGTKEPAVYDYLYKIKSEETSPEEAYTFLEEGRKEFPEDVQLLFSEINHFLKLGKSNELITKLEEAIAAEPENISLYNVLGNTYDNLYKNAIEEEGNQEKANEYFAKAFLQFKKAHEIDPESAIPIYSMGQLFYNKAALKTQDLQEYASDYSSEGMKKYEAAREEVFKQFDNALPFFQMSEALDPNDANTLIALKEIFAKKDDIETSNIFKERLDKVQAGETIDSPHYDAGEIDLQAAISDVEMQME
ncbi:MAG TPA: hypothetical protein VJ953_19270 [Saprospiraceae bacterium]|nr:hypothetical protein [Saprospiraceae bacterium]